MSTIEVFRRRELKYILTRSQQETLCQSLIGRMETDRFGDTCGAYSITSLYFDSDERDIYYAARNNQPFRQKLRLRTYNDAQLDGEAFFEVKQKIQALVNKRRTVLKLSDAYDYLEHRKSLEELQVSNHQIMREVDQFRVSAVLKPTALLTYRRLAYHGIQDPSLRLTFDFDLTCRSGDLRLERGGGRHFISPEKVILEVKVLDAVPLWLARTMSELGLFRNRVSKYCESIELLGGSKEWNQCCPR